jgi:hypothetical protein
MFLYATLQPFSLDLDSLDRLGTHWNIIGNLMATQWEFWWVGRYNQPLLYILKKIG